MNTMMKSLWKELITMAYCRTCPYCGSNNDPGERCDCQDKREGASDAAETPSKSAIDPDRSLSNPRLNVNPCLQLREIRHFRGYGMMRLGYARYALKEAPDEPV